MLTKLGLTIKRIFTKNLDSPYDNIPFKKVTSELKNLDGSSAVKSSSFYAPNHWSSMACDILARNYLRKRGVPLHTKAVAEEGVPSWLSRKVADTSVNLKENDMYGAENDARAVFDRLAGAWTYWGWKGKYFNSEEDAKNFYDEMRFMLAMQMGAPNSPQWFNTGIHWAYGIEGSAQGHYYFDDKEKVLRKSKSAYERPQPHACFIQSVDDDLVNEGGIMDLWVREARLFKFGSGTGSNFSNIRGTGEMLSGGGYSSGLMSFLKIGDTAGGSIKSGGTTRRAAKMVILNIDHPDIETFIKWKAAEEYKVLDLVVGSKIIKKHTELIKEAFHNKKNLKSAINHAVASEIPEAYIARLLSLLKNNQDVDIQEMNFGWESEAYTTVSGQNSNNSVRVTDDFLKAVEEDADFNLTYRTNGNVAKTLKAKYLWDLIATTSWNCADPGLQFDTTINAWHTCINDGRINASNPCSEYMFLDNTACNLASINLCKFVSNTETSLLFDLEGFQHATRLWILVLEISVYMAQFPSKEIALRSYQYRTLGLGYGNLGAFLMQCGIPYDSNEARNIASGLTALMQGVAYSTSAEIASYLGPFERFEHNKENMMRVIRNHAIAATGGSDFIGLNITPQVFDPNECLIPGLSDMIVESWRNAIQKGEQYGYRNAQVSVIAPTGTIGLVMDFKTTGVEPQFSHFTVKHLAGGGILKIVNNEIIKALKVLGYSNLEIEDINHYVIGAGHLDGDIKINYNWLKSKGFTQEDLNRLEASLEKAFDLSQNFNKWVLGEEFFERMGLKDQMDNPTFNLLKHFSATDKEIEEAQAFCCGEMTIEGAPHLKPEHISIFDCAIPCGKKGKRFLSMESHLKMMAAIQPFISGAISKTINLPKTAKIADCEKAHYLAWKLGLKSVALYRDGSKNSQAMNAAITDEINLDEYNEEYDEKYNNENNHTNQENIGNLENNDQIKSQSSSKAANDQKNEYKKTEQNSFNHEQESAFLPFRRRGYTQHVMISENPFWHTTGEDEAGNLKSILLTFGQEGSTLRGWAGAWGRILSMYLQEKGGSALVRAYKAFKHSKFEPMGQIVGHPIIKKASSVPDYIVEDLAHSYSEMMQSKIENNCLPSQRKGKINKIKIGQETIYLIIGEDQDSRPREIFVAGMGNEGSDLKGWMSACTKLISLYFQDCGDKAVWNFVNAFTGSSFEPSGFIQGHDTIRSATSPLDFLAKYIKHHYGNLLSGEQLALPMEEVSKEEASEVLAQQNGFNISKSNFANENKDVEIKLRAISGYKVDEPCRSCKAFKLRYNGTCYICDNCFITTGCS
jgi:ribonucleoside-diphosphate reductase alpha chain